MQTKVITFAAVLLLACTCEALAQRSEKRDKEFVAARPVVGEMLPSVTVFTPDGTELSTDSLRGHYTVLTFGCLT